MRRFLMRRNVDVNGISGTGLVAMGVVFEDGPTVIRWRGQRPSTVVWNSFEDAMAVHGHNGATEFVFLDPEE
jgi:hypothetical protein